MPDGSAMPNFFKESLITPTSMYLFWQSPEEPHALFRAKQWRCLPGEKKAEDIPVIPRFTID